MTLKNLFFIIPFAFLGLVSCEGNINNNANCDKVVIVCNTQNPLEDLVFLKDTKDTIDRIDCGGSSLITQYTYNLETVFQVIICNQVSDHQILVYNCEGEIICDSTGLNGVSTCKDFNDKATDKIILYGN